MLSSLKGVPSRNRLKGHLWNPHLSRYCFFLSVLIWPICGHSPELLPFRTHLVTNLVGPTSFQWKPFHTNRDQLTVMIFGADAHERTKRHSHSIRSEKWPSLIRFPMRISLISNLLLLFAHSCSWSHSNRFISAVPQHILLKFLRSKAHPASCQLERESCNREFHRSETGYLLSNYHFLVASSKLISLCLSLSVSQRSSSTF